MLLLVEICAVIASLAVVVIAVATVRAMYGVERAADQISKASVEIQQWIGQANEFTREARETMVSVRGAIDPIRRVADRFETLGEHTANLSAALLEEVEQPLRTAVMVARAIRSVASYFMKRPSAGNGGSDSERPNVT